MRYILAGLAILISGGAAYSQADYTSSGYCASWCHQYGDGSLSCAYYSFAQCQASRSGIGGSCVGNPLLGQCRKGPAPAHRTRNHHRS